MSCPKCNSSEVYKFIDDEKCVPADKNSVIIKEESDERYFHGYECTNCHG